MPYNQGVPLAVLVANSAMPWVNCLREIPDVLLTVFEAQGLTSGYPRKGLTMARDVSAIEGQNCGIASQASQSRRPCCILLGKLLREKDSFLFIANRIFFRLFFNFLAFSFNHCNH